MEEPVSNLYSKCDDNFIDFM